MPSMLPTPASVSGRRLLESAWRAARDTVGFQLADGERAVSNATPEKWTQFRRVTTGLPRTLAEHQADERTWLAIGCPDDALSVVYRTAGARRLDILPSDRERPILPPGARRPHRRRPARAVAPENKLHPQAPAREPFRRVTWSGTVRHSPALTRTFGHFGRGGPGANAVRVESPGRLRPERVAGRGDLPAVPGRSGQRGRGLARLLCRLPAERRRAGRKQCPGV